MKIKDNETGEVFEYGTNMHHALRISENGGCLTFVNLQNGDGSLKSGDGGYSFVLDDGKTPIESNSPDAINGATYANIGGFHRGSTKNDGWIPVDDRLPIPNKEVWVTAKRNGNVFTSTDTMTESGYFCNYEKENILAWKEKETTPDPYRPERSRENEN